MLYTESTMEKHMYIYRKHMEKHICIYRKYYGISPNYKVKFKYFLNMFTEPVPLVHIVNKHKLTKM